MGSNPVQAWIFFRLSFRNCLSCLVTARIFLLFDLSSAVQKICFIYLPLLRLKFIRSVTAVTLRFVWLLLSDSFGFANLLFIFRVWGKIITLILLENKSTISVLVSNFDQLLTLFDDQLSFCNQLVNISGLLILSPIYVNILCNRKFTSNCLVRLPLYLMSGLLYRT